jgi:hypothetical protein
MAGGSANVEDVRRVVADLKAPFSGLRRATYLKIVPHWKPAMVAWFYHQERQDIVDGIVSPETVRRCASAGFITKSGPAHSHILDNCVAAKAQQHLAFSGTLGSRSPQRNDENPFGLDGLPCRSRLQLSAFPWFLPVNRCIGADSPTAS